MLIKKILRKSIIYLALGFSLNSCIFSNLKLEQALQQKYGEEFIVREDGYDFALGLNVFKASPTQYPDLIFEGRHKDGIITLDYYSEVLWNFEAEKLIRDRLQKENIPCWAKCFVTGDNRFDSNDKLIHFDQLLKNNDTSVTIENVVYLFEDINEGNKDKLLKPIQTLVLFFNNYKDKNIDLVIYFWDQSFTKGKKLGDMFFTLNVDEWDEDSTKEFGDKNDDCSLAKMKYIKHCLNLKYIGGVPYNFSVENMSSLVRPYNITEMKSNIIHDDGKVTWDY